MPCTHERDRGCASEESDSVQGCHFQRAYLLFLGLRHVEWHVHSFQRKVVNIADILTRTARMRSGIRRGLLQWGCPPQMKARARDVSLRDVWIQDSGRIQGKRRFRQSWRTRVVLNGHSGV